MRTRTAVIGALLTVVATGGVLSACGGDDSSSSSATTAAAAATTAAAGATTTADDSYGNPVASTTAAPATTAAAPATTSATSATVKLATTSLGTVLVDATGKTLYMFTKDTPGQPSVCSGQCLVAWPALTGASPTAGTGLDASKLTIIARSDGTPQVAYAGWPLYYYAEDAAPGDVTGQGANKVWFVVDATGTPIGM